MWSAILQQSTRPLDNGKDSVHSNVTCLDIINVFKTILLDDSLIIKAEEGAKSLGKHSLPGEHRVAPNGWDVIVPIEDQLRKKAKIDAHVTPQKYKLMLKGKSKAVKWKVKQLQG